MIFNLPCMSTSKTTKHCVFKTLSKTQLNETRSHCIASEEKRRRKQSFISRYKKKREIMSFVICFVLLFVMSVVDIEPKKHRHQFNGTENLTVLITPCSVLTAI